MIIYGTRNVVLAEEELPNVTCSSCGAESPHLISSFGTHFHVFWIPLLPFRRRTVAMCRSCGASWSHKEMSPTLQAYADILRPKARFKLWQFSGLALVAALVVWGNISSKREAAQEATYLEAPQAGDVYAYKESEGNYSTLKVVEVDDDRIMLLENSMMVNKKRGISRIDLEENYITDTLEFSIAELQDMYAEGTIYDVKRLEL